ncbi:amidohydrolase family protein [Nocardiopsis lambiniae]|uniref:Amidohydrolase family protein n=1 Tax=Nocardiopsis lambiniae TaxID=3075539 RepID=A0ABU2M7B2_9ACTN|nr:amidohydrolase family protein [Nocardiopsis sp. DSM 44743]MDT0328547.1 amidohydrolase family protein [Nocardiopsis sp. DSM 44743]
MRIVDAQIHLWEGPDAPPHHARSPFTMETAVEAMTAAGVDRAINCPALWDADANAYAALAASTHPERFTTMGWFPLSPGGDASLVADAMAAPGAVGLRFVIVDPAEVARVASGELDWLWRAADERALPVALMVLPGDLPLIGGLAGRFPRMRLMVDHLGVLPFLTLPEAMAHLDDLLDLARHPNIAVKATGVPSMATDPYPFVSTHDALRRIHDAFGAERMFWGTDVTRMDRTWGECVTMFVDHLPWLTGRDLELVMGDAVTAWLDRR